MGVKIQINSLEALERLIGGDTELEIDIRESIIYNFASKHLKSIVGEVMNKYEQDLKKDFEKEIKSLFNNSNTKSVLSIDSTSRIRQEVKSLFDSEVGHCIQEEVMIYTKSIGEILKGKLIDQHFEYMVKEKAKELIRKAGL